MPRQRITTQPMSQINVTSLLDIVFVLLIAFMIVAPALKHGLDLELPRVGNAPALDPQKPLNLLVTSTDGVPEIFINETPTSFVALAEDLRLAAAGDTERAIALQADRRTDWEAMSQVIAELRGAGFLRVGIVTTPKDA